MEDVLQVVALLRCGASLGFYCTQKIRDQSSTHRRGGGDVAALEKNARKISVILVCRMVRFAAH